MQIPNKELAELRSKKITILTPFIEIFHAIKEMPANMWRLFVVYLFQWFALKCYWDYKDLTIAKTIFKTSDSSSANKVYQEAVGWGGLISGWTNIITFLSKAVISSMVFSRISSIPIKALYESLQKPINMSLILKKILF